MPLTNTTQSTVSHPCRVAAPARRAAGGGATRSATAARRQELAALTSGANASRIVTVVIVTSQEMGKKLVLITPSCATYLEPVFGLSMAKIAGGGTRNSYYRNKQRSACWGGRWDTIATRELKRQFELHGRHLMTVGNVCAILGGENPSKGISDTKMGLFRFTLFQPHACLIAVCSTIASIRSATKWL
jgi:hypothetical protein